MIDEFTSSHLILPQAKAKRGHIALAHGGGGQLTDELIESSILPRIGNETLNDLLDAAVVRNSNQRIVFTLDGYVVQPLTFPGGDIGRLAVCGTVNDLAVMAAKPLAIALGLILAEGLDRSVLDGVLGSIAAASKAAGVPVVTGDTKVVGRNHADGMYITTAGVGSAPHRVRVHPDFIAPGDVILINGPIADHGLAVMLAREMPEVTSVLRSDVAPLNRLIERVLERAPGVIFMRDPTRGGVAGLCANIASRTGWHVRLDESEIPIRPETRHAAEMLGLDPLEVANEGKVVFFVRPANVERALETLRSDPYGAEARVIGAVEETRDGLCELVTKMGGRRIIQKPYGEQLPRIC
jgi:hydrogenase expression/formation protein HypE